MSAASFTTIYFVIFAVIVCFKLLFRPENKNKVKEPKYTHLPVIKVVDLSNSSEKNSKFTEARVFIEPKNDLVLLEAINQINHLKPFRHINGASRGIGYHFQRLGREELLNDQILKLNQTD